MATGKHQERPRSGRSSAVRIAVLSVLSLVIVGVLLALGTWQVKRLFWKLDLIARVEARVSADAVPAPDGAEWARTDAALQEYRRVRLTGTFLHDKEVQVYATTESGPGYWVMTPLRQEEGTLVFVNRGFVPMDMRDPATRPQGELPGLQTVTGLLRLSETAGLFSRSDDPASGRWYTRDVAVLAKGRDLGPVAPYFVDADATPNPGGYPVGGMTRLVFTNNHLVYAFTWYAMALMAAAAAIYVLRLERREKQQGEAGT